MNKNHRKNCRVGAGNAEINIEKLIADAELVADADLKAALAAAAAAESKKKQEKLLAQYKSLGVELDRRISDLREVRKLEKARKEIVQSLAQALESFKGGRKYDEIIADLQGKGIYLNY